MTLPDPWIPDPPTRRNFEAIDGRFPLGPQDIQDDAIGTAQLAAVPACRVHNAADQSIADATTTTLTWDTETTPSYDPSGMHAGGSPTRITITEAGLYRVAAGIGWDTSGTGYREVRIHLNGGGTVLAWNTCAAVTGTGTVHFCSDEVRLAANDYIESKGTQNSGGALNALTLGGSTTFLSARWLGP